VKSRFTAKNFTVLIKNLRGGRKLSVAAGIENNLEDKNCVVDAAFHICDLLVLLADELIRNMNSRSEGIERLQ
jgi:hypothetical protein